MKIPGVMSCASAMSVSLLDCHRSTTLHTRVLSACFGLIRWTLDGDMITSCDVEALVQKRTSYSARWTYVCIFHPRLYFLSSRVYFLFRPSNIATGIS